MSRGNARLTSQGRRLPVIRPVDVHPNRGEQLTTLDVLLQAPPAAHCGAEFSEASLIYPGGSRAATRPWTAESCGGEASVLQGRETRNDTRSCRQLDARRTLAGCYPRERGG